MENLYKCMHDDCFTCPYLDCISNTEPVKHKPGRKKLSPEEKASRKREQYHQWYERNRARILEENKEKYYRRKKEKKKIRDKSMAIIKVSAKGCYFCGKKKDLIKLHIAAPFQENHNNSLNDVNICKDCKDKLITILDRDYPTKDSEK